MGWILAVYDQQIQHDTPLCGATDLYFSTYWMEKGAVVCFCLLYTSDAADE